MGTGGNAIEESKTPIGISAFLSMASTGVKIVGQASIRTGSILR